MTEFEIYKQKGTGITKEVKNGYSWPCLFFGMIWFFYKGMIGKGFLWGAVAFFISLLTFGFGGLIVWLVLGFEGNKMYKEFLLEKGYKKIKTIRR